MHRDLQFHHIGLACRDMAQDRRDHESLGYRAEGKVFEDPLQRIRGLFMTLGTMRVELLEPLEPLDETSPLMGYLKRGIKIYHQGFVCDDVARAIEDLQRRGARLVSPPQPAVAFENCRIAFLILQSRMLIELIESAAARSAVETSHERR